MKGIAAGVAGGAGLGVLLLYITGDTRPGSGTFGGAASRGSSSISGGGETARGSSPAAAPPPPLRRQPRRAAAPAPAPAPAGVARRWRPLQPGEWGEGCDEGPAAAAPRSSEAGPRAAPAAASARLRFEGHDAEEGRVTVGSFAELERAIASHPRARGREVRRVWYRAKGWRCRDAVIPPAKVTLRPDTFPAAIPMIHEGEVGVTLVPMCRTSPGTELWGDVVTPGDKVLVDSAEECCRRCQGSPGAECNVWVWCGEKEECTRRGQYRQCWLKRQATPESARTMGKGPSVPWTSGSFYEDR